MCTNKTYLIVQLTKVLDNVIVLSIPHFSFCRISNSFKVKQTFSDMSIDEIFDLLNLFFVSLYTPNLCKVIYEVVNTIQTIRTNLSCIIWVPIKQMLNYFCST